MTTTQPASNSFAKRLAHTDKKIRDKAVKALGKWLSSKEDLDQLELLKLWKGLFYCFWMSDKPLIQQQLSNTLATMILGLPTTIVIPFVKAFWEIIVREWNGIDRYRLDKFYLLLRRYVHYTLVLLMNNDWDTDLVDQYVDMMKSGIFSPSNFQVPDSIRTHIVDLFLEELEKVVPVEKTEEIPIDRLLEPFLYFISRNSNMLVYKRIHENLLDPFLEHLKENDMEENQEKRHYNFSSISKLLTELIADAETTGVKRRRISKLLCLISGTSEETEVQDGDSMDAEEPESEDSEVLEITKADSKKRKRQKGSQTQVETSEITAPEVLSEPVQATETKKKRKQKTAEKSHEETAEVVSEPVQVKEIKKKKKQKVVENPVDSESLEVAEEIVEPVKVKPSKKQKKQKVIEETIQQIIEETQAAINTEASAKKVLKKSKKQKVVEPEVAVETPVVQVTIKKSKKVKVDKVAREGNEASTPKLAEPSTPLSSASKKSVQWGLENNSVKRFKKQLPVSPKPSPVASDRKPIKSALKKSKRSITVTATKSSV